MGEDGYRMYICILQLLEIFIIQNFYTTEFLFCIAVIQKYTYTYMYIYNIYICVQLYILIIELLFLYIRYTLYSLRR